MPTEAYFLPPADSLRPAPDLSGGREPPHNLEAEAALLGAILGNNNNFHKIVDFLSAEHFAHAAHGRIFAAIAALIDRGMLANKTTLRTYFEQDGGLAEIGGPGFLAEIQRAAGGILNVEQYGRLVRDLYLRRRLIEVGEDCVNDAHDARPDSSAEDALERAERRLFTLAESGQTSRGFTSLGGATIRAVKQAEAAIRRESRITGVTTGLRDVDRALGGLHRSDLVILAGRPGMGKTALATNIAFNAAEAALGEKDPESGAVVAFFSLEMSAEQLALRILAERTGVALEKIRTGEIKAQEFTRFVEESRRLSRMPVHIDDAGALSIGQLRARARRLKRTEGLGLVVVDYLQLLRADGQYGDNRVQEISEITRGLKALAKELEVPVLALSQLSRGVEQREDKRPLLSDLRESGSIEQDADVVMFVFREDYYLKNAEPRQREGETEEKFHERYFRWQEHSARVYNTAEVNIAKHRHGPTASIKLFFDGRLTKFGDLAESDRYPDP